MCDGQSEVRERTRQEAQDERNTMKESTSGGERERKREGWEVRGGQVLDR